MERLASWMVNRALGRCAARIGVVVVRLAWARHLDWHSRRGGQAGIIAALSFTVWLNWGSTYYLLTVLAGPMAGNMGWPVTSLVAGLSAGLVIAGLASPAMGRAIERRGGRPVLAFGSFALASGLALLGLAQDLVSYFAAWVVLGIGMSASLYDAAFAALGRLYGLQARGMISSLMLIVGFALVTSWPLTALMVGALGWRGACFCYAAMHISLALPTHVFLLPRETARPVASPLVEAPAETSPLQGHAADQTKAGRSLLVWLVGTNLTLQIGIASALAVNLLTLLQSLGVAFTASVALGSLIWLAQGAGRLLEVSLGRRFHPVWEGVGASVFVLVGLVLLLAAQPLAIAVGLFLFGLGNGVRGIVKGTLPLVLFGAAGYATLVGRLGLPTLIAQAAGPALAAIALTKWGVMPSLLALTGLALVNLLLSYALRIALPRDEQAPYPSPVVPTGSSSSQAESGMQAGSAHLPLSEEQGARRTGAQ
ncbi:MAG TPA: MFS transporter [Stellaceae bacterium]